MSDREPEASAPGGSGDAPPGDATADARPDAGVEGAGPVGPHTSADPEGSSGGGPGTVFHCDLCGAEMLNLHCKLICERCGYKRDCSDP